MTPRPRRRTTAAVVAVCPRCGQAGDERPGLRLGEYERLEAVWVGDTALVGDNLPQKLTCAACGHSWPVARGVIRVRPEP